MLYGRRSPGDTGRVVPAGDQENRVRSRAPRTIAHDDDTLGQEHLPHRLPSADQTSVPQTFFKDFSATGCQLARTNQMIIPISTAHAAVTASVNV